ncbi:MAG: hypothetical protein A2045_12745 [Rhodocyclales bacterium GWA2_65_20]|nr:MAG: hypothetical protein A2045_12745 [Rhodocyclales bacterium GWA2_65_20]
MRRLRHPLFALLLSLLLVGGQQAALAHMLGHAAGAAAARGASGIAQQEGADHGAALTLSHVCTTCIAVAGVAAAPPAAFLAVAMPVAPTAALVPAVPPAPTFGFCAAFRSRAPPLL